MKIYSFVLKTIVLFEYFVKIHRHHERRIFFKVLGKTMNGNRQGSINGLKRNTDRLLLIRILGKGKTQNF